MKLVTADQMAGLERAAVAAGVSERAMMEEAGLAAAQEAWMAVGAAEGRPILVLCGPGHNGGDGLVAAKHLAGWGADVRAYLLRARAEADPVWREAQEAGVSAENAEEDSDFARLDALLSEASLVLDALLGTGGGARPIEGRLAGLLGRVRAARAAPASPHLIALDLPSGVDPDSGAADPTAVAADLTISFGHPKVGLSQLPGLELAGRVLAVGIGIPADASAPLPYEQLDFRAVQETMPGRPPGSHKGSFGTAVVAAGSRRYAGAARLAAEAAARSGAGLVAVAAQQALQPLLVGGLPDAVHEPLATAPGSPEGELDGRAARALVRALGSGSLSRATALLVGPGIGTGRAPRAFVRELLSGLDGAGGDLRGVVVDADALSALARLPGWADRLALPRVLTPHPGEMARLARCSVADVQSNRLRCALDAARETASIVVLKGACTVVAAPDGRARISGEANPMLATAGTGDVLAGLLTGLLAQGMEPFDAAAAAVYMHGDCGRRVAESHGTAAGLAQDLLRALPEVTALLEGRPRGAGPGAGIAPGLFGGPEGGAGAPPAGGSLW